MKRRWGTLVAVAALAGAWSVGCQVAGGVIEVRLGALEDVYGYGQLRESAFDLRTALTSVARVNAELEVIHTNGWYSSWGGDGPLGAGLFVGLNNVPWANPRTTGQVVVLTNGQSTVVFPIPTGDIVPDWSELLNGRAAVYAHHDTWSFAEGWLVKEPYLQILRFVLRIEALPMAQLAYNGVSGELKWSPIPQGVRLGVYSATNVSGPWEFVGEYDANGPFPILPISDGKSRFFKATWTEVPGNAGR